MIGVRGGPRAEVVENADVRHTATRRSDRPPRRRCCCREMSRPGAEVLVGRVGAVDGRVARVLGGDVDVESGVVLGDPLPHRLDLLLLDVAERAEVAVEAVPGVEAVGQSRVPRRPGDRGAVEVEVDHMGRRRAAVQQEGLVERERRHALGERRSTAVGRLDVEHPRVPVEPGGGVLPQNPAQLGGTLAVGRRLRRPGRRRAARSRPTRAPAAAGRARPRPPAPGTRTVSDARGEGCHGQPGRPDHPHRMTDWRTGSSRFLQNFGSPG